MNATVGLFLAVLAGLLLWRRWWEGKWNVGPRLTALAILTVGAAGALAIAGAIGLMAQGFGAFFASLVSDAGWPRWSNDIHRGFTDGPWIFGWLLLLWWLVAMFPNTRLTPERMTWELAMAGVLIPALILLAPVGPRTLGQVVTSHISTATSAAAAAVLRTKG